MRCRVALACVGLLGSAMAQEPLVERDRRIDERYADQEYGEVVELVDQQLKDAPGTTWQDSLFRYAYRYGRSHWKLKDADAGMVAFERFRSMVEARDRHAEHRLSMLRAGSDLSTDLGRGKEALHYDSLGIALVEREPGIPGAQRGKAYHVLGVDLQAAGDPAAAITAFKKAIAILNGTEPLPTVALGSAYNAIGACNWQLGNDAEAEANYLKARDQLHGTTDPEGLNRLAGVFGNLGILRQSRGDLDRAKAYYQQSLAMTQRLWATATDPQERDRLQVMRSRSYLNLATIYFKLSDHARSRRLLDLAWADRSAVLSPDDPRLLSLREAMADQEFMVGDLEVAERYFREVQSGYERTMGVRSMYYFRVSAKLAELLAERGDHGSSEALFVRTMALAEGNALITPQQFAEACSRYARALSANGRYDASIAMLQRARMAYEGIRPTGHYTVVRTILLQADAAHKAKDHATAHRLAEEAIALMTPRIDAIRNGDGPLVFEEPQMLHNAVLYKVEAERATAHAGKDHAQWLEEIDIVVRGLDRNRSALADDASKLHLTGMQYALMDLGLDVAYEAYAQAPTEAALQRFLDLDEADRSVLLKNRLNGFTGMRFGDVPDSVLAEEQQLVAALEVDGSDEAAVEALHTNEKAFGEFLVRIKRDHPRYHALRYGSAGVPLAEVRERLLTRDRDLLVYAIGKDHLYATVITLDSARIFRLSLAGLDAQVQRLQEAIERRNVRAYAEEAHALYARIWAPIAPSLRNPEVFIVPDGPLHAVNFETLLDRPSSAADLKQHLLLRKHAIAYLLSVTTGVQFAKLDREPSRGVLAMAPGFTDEVKQQYLAQVPDTNLLDRDYLRYVRQPFAVDAVEGLEGLLNARVRVGGAATEKDFRKEADRYGVLHFGTHASIDPVAPLYSRLVLSKDGDGLEADADGYLHAFEIYELQLRAELAVLTACETGSGRIDHGEGVRSLGHGFAYAGCPSVVLSLWRIDEKTSADVITRFYRHIAAGKSKHIALQQAKLEYLDAVTSDELALPYYWGGLVLVGDVEPVHLSFFQRYRWWLWVSLALLGASVLWWWRRKRA